MSSVIERKQAVVDELAGKLGDATAFFLTDFTGLSVKGMTELRARLREAGVEYVVVKNTLAKRALDGLDLPDIGEFFTGPTGLVIGRESAVEAAKILDEFAKQHEDRPRIKAGLVERKQVTAAEVGRLAKLPPREQLLAELLGALQAPLAQFAFVIQAPIYEFAGLLEALRAERDQA
jgi:large subunit ribosomal protein L10